MVNISIQADRIHLDVEGVDKLWALRSHLEFPLSHIRSVAVDPAAARGWWHGLRPERTIVLELDHEHYDRLIVEVDDPEKARALIERAIARAMKQP